MNYRDKKYRDETVFQLINKNYLTLKEQEIRDSNDHLKLVIEYALIPLLKNDELFKIMYKKIMYGGSYYKGTKFGKPEEFDLDLIIELPIKYDKLSIDTNHDNYGFVKIKIDTQKPLHPNWNKHEKIISKWLTVNNYFDQEKFRSWIERVFTTTFSLFATSQDGYYLMFFEGKTYKVKHKKSGPAFTVLIKTPNGNTIDVDLVPCLEFNNVPLGNGYRKLDGIGRQNWMVVAKPLSNDIIDKNMLWRLCFYEQEKKVLRGDIKPVIRMMKKFRDTQRWNIASYYIETIFYHELEKNKSDLDNFLKAPKTWLFMFAMRKLSDALEKHEIPYFWHSNCNLLGKINKTEIRNYADRMKRLIAMIDSKIENDKFVLAEVVLGSSEANTLRAIAAQPFDNGTNENGTKEEATSSCTIL